MTVWRPFICHMWTFHKVDKYSQQIDSEKDLILRMGLLLGFESCKPKFHFIESQKGYQGLVKRFAEDSNEIHFLIVGNGLLNVDLLWTFYKWGDICKFLFWHPWAAFFWDFDTSMLISTLEGMILHLSLFGLYKMKAC